MQPYHNPALDELATRLFREFARLEYALKAAGFHNGDGRAEPNWRNFAMSIEGTFANLRSKSTRQAIDYILAHPPKKQVVRDGVLDWEDAQPATDSHADLILLYVRRVRNNLFHGGKFNGRWFDPERSVELLRYSIEVLDACLAASDAVKDAYDH